MSGIKVTVGAGEGVVFLSIDSGNNTCLLGMSPSEAKKISELLVIHAELPPMIVNSADLPQIVTARIPTHRDRKRKLCQILSISGAQVSSTDGFTVPKERDDAID